HLRRGRARLRHLLLHHRRARVRRPRRPPDRGLRRPGRLARGDDPARRRPRAGRYVADPPWVLVATPTLADPGRAPAGHHTVKILSPQVYALPGGPGEWETAKEEHARRLLARLRAQAPNFTDEVILDHLTKSPADIEQLN